MVHSRIFRWDLVMVKNITKSYVFVQSYNYVKFRNSETHISRLIIGKKKKPNESDSYTNTDNIVIYEFDNRPIGINGKTNGMKSVLLNANSTLPVRL